MIGAPNEGPVIPNSGAAHLFDLGRTVRSRVDATWWAPSSLAEPLTSPSMLTVSNLAYRFAGWEIEGVLQSNAVGELDNPLRKRRTEAPIRTGMV